MMLAHVLAEQTASMLWALDVALLAAAEAIRARPDLAEHDAAYEDSLRRLSTHVPAVRALFVIGADGFIVQDTDQGTPRRNLADRDYFQAHAVSRDRGLFIGRPMVSRSVDTWCVGLSRRLDKQDGSFAGVVVAAVDVHYFETLYEAIGVQTGDVIALVTSDAEMVALRPMVDRQVRREVVIVDDLRKLITLLASEPQGSFETISGTDGKARIFGYRVIQGRPLAVLVGLSQERVLASWRHSAIAVAMLTLAVAALAALLLWLAVRHGREEAAAQARLQEGARLEALGRLTGGVAHDFNNLLLTMAAALRLLGGRSSEDASAREVVELGLAALERGRRQVARLLGIARPQAVRVQDVDVNALLSEMSTLLRSTVAPSARLELALATNLRRCRADPSRLDAAVLNLVMNASDAMPQGRCVKGLIQIATMNCEEAIRTESGRRLDAGHFVCLTVRDDGTGMTAEVRRRALEPFFTTKGEHGTGIGLAQVSAFVRELGGDIRIETQVGAGTAVHIYLPVA